MPIKTVTIRPTDKPWFSSELHREIRRRDRLHKIMKRTNQEDDILRFKRQRNKVNMKKYARLSFYENLSGLIDQYSKTDSKAYWKLMKKVINTNHSIEIPPLYNVENDSLIDHDTDKADLLNTYFSSISDLDDNYINPPSFATRTDERHI